MRGQFKTFVPVENQLAIWSQTIQDEGDVFTDEDKFIAHITRFLDEIAAMSGLVFVNGEKYKWLNGLKPNGFVTH
ncbi:hypothetical protein THRCLA_22006 [Thraustotheca clavata]|uniref:Uncharacterized protein n=1 Tax=Thraustotheca clavata TaxID=74557 RepID=A0A1V9ZE85_9STRA|nr:hypothetical protein THRCLA_22006 [Thraustotheca clavata]